EWRRVQPAGRSVEAGQVTFDGQRSGTPQAAEEAQVTPRARSITAAANASGASWGRLCPMPPSIVRCEYGPENFAAYALGSGWGAPLASPSSVIVGTPITGLSASRRS